MPTIGCCTARIGPRVEAEIVRDLHLSVSGLLSKKVGGESVFPPIPADVGRAELCLQLQVENQQRE
jgi:hypothetical protein